MSTLCFVRSSSSVVRVTVLLCDKAAAGPQLSPGPMIKHCNMCANHEDSVWESM